MLKLYDKSKIDKNNLLFDGKALRILMVPLIVEQLLNSFMGIGQEITVVVVISLTGEE